MKQSHCSLSNEAHAVEYTSNLWQKFVLYILHLSSMEFAHGSRIPQDIQEKRMPQDSQYLCIVLEMFDNSAVPRNRTLTVKPSFWKL
jgi:hypothetical protein